MMPTKTSGVRIESDGTIEGTRVFVDDRDMSDFVEAVEWSHEAGDMPRARITFNRVEARGVGSVVDCTSLSDGSRRYTKAPQGPVQ